MGVWRGAWGSGRVARGSGLGHRFRESPVLPPLYNSDHGAAPTAHSLDAIAGPLRATSPSPERGSEIGWVGEPALSWGADKSRPDGAFDACRHTLRYRNGRRHQRVLTAAKSRHAAPWEEAAWGGTTGFARTCSRLGQPISRTKYHDGMRDANPCAVIASFSCLLARAGSSLLWPYPWTVMYGCTGASSSSSSSVVCKTCLVVLEKWQRRDEAEKSKCRRRRAGWTRRGKRRSR